MSQRKDLKVCRICLKSDSQFKKKCVSIFEKHKDCLVSESINSIANVKIHEGDGLPSSICPDCLLELDAAVNFKIKCESSNTLLRTTLLYSNKPIEKENSKNLRSSNFEYKAIKKEEPDLPDYLEVDYLVEDDECIENEISKAKSKESKDNRTCHISNEIYHEIEITPKLEVITGNITEEELDLIARKSRAIDLKLQCNECGGSFKSKCKLRVHWKKVHLPETLICMLCKRSFKTYRAFNRHKKVKTQACLGSKKIQIEGIGRSRVFYCKECSYSSRRIKDILTHLVIHSGERPFACDLCPKAFGQQSALQGHKESAHKIYKAETTCQYCGKHLKGRRVIYKHLKTHSDSFYQCDICKKTLKSKASLISHIVRHTGIKSYTCEKCANSYYTLSELCNHKRLQHDKGKYIYQCDKCSYTTFRTETLKKHKARHTDTNLPCVVCGMFLENAEKLKDHQKRHFGARNFACPHCEKRYMHRKALSQHVRDIHKCTFLVNKPIKREAKPIKQELIESPNLPSKSFGNMIEVEVSPLSVS